MDAPAISVEKRLQPLVPPNNTIIIKNATTLQRKYQGTI